MLYNEFKDLRLSALGFGAMRLPLNPDGSVDAPQVKQMVDYAMAHGVNYYDTAWPYHNGASERVLTEALREYDRNTYYLADKYPGHQIASRYDPAAIFERQLKKCGVEYFDFYLLHNVYEKSMDVYLDPQWGILEYFKEQKRLGRIRHLGFSSHGRLENLREFLDICGDDMEFCQIQLNYMDWTLQDAKAKYELLTQRGIPVWVMEPVRGGKLAKLKEDDEKRLLEARPDESIPAWCFRFLQELPNVKVVLSGMSKFDQMVDNVKTYAERRPLSPAEHQMLLDIAEGLKDSIPCTACRYCCDGCPMGLDIPMLLSVYNEIRFAPTTNSIMRIEALPEDKQPAACLACGKCAQVCPQNIDIPQAMRDFTAAIKKIPSWAETCRQREAAQSLDD